ncbi:MAG: hypothetical protein WC763_06865 [Candidatus Paceibacterota bacterium]|jgi:hypothetical protein
MVASTASFVAGSIGADLAYRLFMPIVYATLVVVSMWLLIWLASDFNQSKAILFLLWSIIATAVWFAWPVLQILWVLAKAFFRSAQWITDGIASTCRKNVHHKQQRTRRRTNKSSDEQYI